MPEDLVSWANPALTPESSRKGSLRSWNRYIASEKNEIAMKQTSMASWLSRRD